MPSCRSAGAVAGGRRRVRRAFAGADVPALTGASGTTSGEPDGDHPPACRSGRLLTGLRAGLAFGLDHEFIRGSRDRDYGGVIHDPAASARWWRRAGAVRGRGPDRERGCRAAAVRWTLLG